MTPKQTPTTPGAASISDFLLDSRTPSTPGGTQGGGYDAEEAAREKDVDRKVEELVKEARIWRVANSAQWVAWGIVQAKVPELDEAEEASSSVTISASPGPIDADAPRPTPMTDLQSDEAVQHQNSHDHDQRPEEGHGEDDDEFDYLGYAQERAMFFWGDLVEMGLVRKDELPADLVSHLKTVKY
jgi:choline kinase